MKQKDVILYFTTTGLLMGVAITQDLTRNKHTYSANELYNLKKLYPSSAKYLDKQEHRSYKQNSIPMSYQNSNNWYPNVWFPQMYGDVMKHLPTIYQLMYNFPHIRNRPFRFRVRCPYHSKRKGHKKSEKPFWNYDPVAKPEPTPGMILMPLAEVNRLALEAAKREGPLKHSGLLFKSSYSDPRLQTYDTKTIRQIELERPSGKYISSLTPRSGVVLRPIAEVNRIAMEAARREGPLRLSGLTFKSSYSDPRLQPYASHSIQQTEFDKTFEKPIPFPKPEAEPEVVLRPIDEVNQIAMEAARREGPLKLSGLTFQSSYSDPRLQPYNSNTMGKTDLDTPFGKSVPIAKYETGPQMALKPIAEVNRIAMEAARREGPLKLSGLTFQSSYSDPRLQPYNSNTIRKTDLDTPFGKSVPIAKSETGPQMVLKPIAEVNRIAMEAARREGPLNLSGLSFESSYSDPRLQSYPSNSLQQTELDTNFVKPVPYPKHGAEPEMVLKPITEVNQIAMEAARRQGPLNLSGFAFQSSYSDPRLQQKTTL